MTSERAAAFCAVLAETCQVRKAAATIGISVQTAYNWRQDFPEFAEQWDRALRAGVMGLESEAHRRGFDGVDEPLTHQGMMTYRPRFDPATGALLRDESGKVLYETDSNGRPIPETVKKYSDTLAIFLLKAHDPQRYRENSRIELAGDPEAPLQMDVTQRDARIAQILGAAAARRDAQVADDDDISDLV